MSIESPAELQNRADVAIRDARGFFFEGELDRSVDQLLHSVMLIRRLQTSLDRQSLPTFPARPSVEDAPGPGSANRGPGAPQEVTA